MLFGIMLIAAYLLQGLSANLTLIGFLRKLSLDEPPQLWSILKGVMRFVDPILVLSIWMIRLRRLRPVRCRTCYSRVYRG